MFCFDKTRRLLTKKDYDRVFQQAKKISSSEFIFLYRDNPCGYSRLGLAISKKMVAKAHDRNQIKRLLRETFRLREQLPQVDVVVLVRNKISHIKKQAMIASLDKIWDKLADS